VQFIDFTEENKTFQDLGYKPTPHKPFSYFVYCDNDGALGVCVHNAVQFIEADCSVM